VIRVMGKHWTGHNYLALYACLQAGENSSWWGAGGLPEEHRKGPAPSSSSLHVADITLIAVGDNEHPPRLGARPRGDAGLRGDFARLIAAIGDPRHFSNRERLSRPTTHCR